ncbi:L,D-transpeptidase family protein [Sphingomonas sp.]|uniref:L,D-transpeptidase family protein n=1 Tax=Sphingomonas sp. TaxID=28214 RepID=UPI0038B002EB
MRGGVIAVAAAVVAASAAAWAFALPDRGTSIEAAAQAASASGPAGHDRLFLTKAQLDQAIASGTLDRPVKSLLAVRVPLHFGDYSWNDRGVPAGTTWLRIDLRSQLISVFRAGHEIGTAVIVYGGDNKQTPAGKLHILAKAQNHRSSLYDAAMPYTLRLTGDGVSIHASNVSWGAATHGCIGVPMPFAERLFNATRVGDEVVVVGLPLRAATA